MNVEQTVLSEVLQDNVEQLKQVFERNSDCIFQSIMIAGRFPAMITYFDNTCDTKELNRSVITPLHRMQQIRQVNMDDLRNVIDLSHMKTIQNLDEAVQNILSGNPVLLTDQVQGGLVFSLAQWEQRGIEDPMAENVIRGPREGFTESVGVNISMVRRRLKTSDFKTEECTIGTMTNTKVVVAYSDSLSHPTIREELKKRLQKIKIDKLIESGELEELIEDQPYSPFPTIIASERPDVITAAITEGRIAIFTDGTPFVLVVPSTMNSFFQSPEDFNQRLLIGSFIRFLRYAFYFISLLAPATYVALLSFHQEMIPTLLLLNIASSRESVPLPAVVEALLMEIMFEGLREAGVRLPKQIGAAISIVGALVIGQASISAGLVTAPMVVIVAITGIASFMVPHYAEGIAPRLLRFPLMIMAGTMGLLGLMLGTIAVVIHLCSLRSFGVPYLVPVRAKDLKDTVIRLPIWSLDERPSTAVPEEITRQAPHQKPE
ncbi:spore germination protein [Paenibacillus selenitireducens]